MNEPQRIRLVRAIEFSAALRYAHPELSREANRDLYGSLYHEKGLGTNFRLEASFVGVVDRLTGMIINLVDIDRWLKAVISGLENRFLNEVFSKEAPTPERLARFCYESLELLVKAEASASASLEKIRLFEGESLAVTYSKT